MKETVWTADRSRAYWMALPVYMQLGDGVAFKGEALFQMILELFYVGLLPFWVQSGTVPQGALIRAMSDTGRPLVPAAGMPIFGDARKAGAKLTAKNWPPGQGNVPAQDWRALSIGTAMLATMGAARILLDNTGAYAGQGYGIESGVEPQGPDPVGGRSVSVGLAGLALAADKVIRPHPNVATPTKQCELAREVWWYCLDLGTAIAQSTDYTLPIPGSVVELAGAERDREGGALVSGIVALDAIAAAVAIVAKVG